MWPCWRQLLKDSIAAKAVLLLSCLNDMLYVEVGSYHLHIEVLTQLVCVCERERVKTPGLNPQIDSASLTRSVLIWHFHVRKWTKQILQGMAATTFPDQSHTEFDLSDRRLCWAVQNHLEICLKVSANHNVGAAMVGEAHGTTLVKCFHVVFQMN